MDILRCMKVFARVAQRSGFAATAREMRMSPAAVTKHIAYLESRIGARLFDRTTRKVGLTEAGRVYLEHCLECLQAVADADASVNELSKQPKGHLRVTTPIDLGNQMSPIIARFMRAYPQVSVELQLSNRPVDLIEEGIDVAIRVAASLDGSAVARQLALSRVGIFASPTYLDKHGRPRKPEDLERHHGLVFLEPRPRDEWMLQRGDVSVRVKFKGMFTTNSGAALSIVSSEGVGLVVGPSFVMQADFDAGKLEQVLPEWKVLPDLYVYALYPHRRFLAPKVRAFVETLRAAFGDGTSDPWWPPSLPAPMIEKSGAVAAKRLRRTGRADNAASNQTKRRPVHHRP
jgi:DNA-binding transcriptional LysR family regulator